MWGRAKTLVSKKDKDENADAASASESTASEEKKEEPAISEEK